MKKLLFIFSHPSYYVVPILRRLHRLNKIKLMVAYCTKLWVGSVYDKQFNKKVDMGLPVLDGYRYKFLKNYSFSPKNSFLGQLNFSIANEIKNNEYDGVMIHGWNSFTNWLAALTCFVTKTPLLIRSESPLNQEKKKSRIKVIFKKIVLEKFLFKFASAFLYIGEQNKEFYKYYGVPEKKLFFTPYAVDNKRFQKAAENLRPKRDELRRNLNIKPNDIAILFVGKLIEKKRPLDLLKAFRLLNKEESMSNTHLVYVGDGSLRPELEKYTRDHNIENVHFVGFKNQNKLPQYYIVSDIFVLPSGTGETWGLVVNEAMNFGLPIIISDIPGSGFDLVKDKKNGYVFPVGNIKELADKIELLVKDKNQIKKLDQKSLAIVKQYNYEKDVEGILKAL